MKFYSTQHKSPVVGLENAVMTGLAPDGGLYMPEMIPRLPERFFEKAASMTFPDIAFEVSKPFFLPQVPEPVLKSLINDSYTFDVPLIELEKHIFVLELFHGPTCAFKDFAARFMARLFAYFAEKTKREITMLVATSGDTGSAVAHGFLNVKGMKVIIVYPSKKVSPLQEKQLTGMGGNITALEVQGTFDDCQRLVKEAFRDGDLRKKMTLASANSINIARLIPQTFYYVYLCARLIGTLGTRSHLRKPNLVVSVPSGNFGNLTAGIIAKKMGAPIAKFVASTNANDIVPHYLENGEFMPKSSIATISNAMDVGSPSNFARMLELYDYDVEKMREDILGLSFSDDETRNAMLNVFHKDGYILDPHGAVAYLGLMDYATKTTGDNFGVFLETAHPAKFFEEVEKVIQKKVPIPKQLNEYLNRKKSAITIGNNYDDLKKLLK